MKPIKHDDTPSAHPAPYLDAEQLLALLPPQAALQAIQRFFADHPPDAVNAPARIHLPVPGQDTIGLYMPAATGQYVGVKIAHLMPSRMPSVEAEVFLYNAETGKLLFWGDGKPLTALRTSAVSVAASLKLHPRCLGMVVFGAGVQAAAHITAFASAYPDLREISAVTRSDASFRRLSDALAAPEAAKLRPVENQPAAIAKAVSQADCVVTTTPAPAPLFAWDDLAPGAHVVGIGSATPAMNELPPVAFKHGAAWVDTLAAFHEAGDLIEAAKMGVKEADMQGDLFDLLGASSNSGAPNSASAPREGGGRTVFKSVGHAVQDLAILIHLWEALQGQA